MAQPLWLAPIHRVATVGTKVVILNQLTGQPCGVDRGLYEKLYPVGGDASHATAPAASTRALSGADLREAEEAQLIIHERSVLKWLMHSREEPPCRIGAVAITTKNRPKTLARLLKTLLVTRHVHGRDYRIIVVDDSNGSHCERVRATIASLGKLHHTSIEYVGQTERRRLIAAMSAKETLGKRLLSFSLMGAGYVGPTFGAALNSALLWTAGTPVAVFDDDIVPRVGVPDYADLTRMILSPDGDPTALRIHTSLRAAAKTIRWSDTDPLASHERILGASLSHLVRRLPSHMYPDAPPGSFKVIRSMPVSNSRVGLSAFGIVGDCGMGSLQNYVGIKGDDLVHLTASRAAYGRLVRSRWVARAAPSLTINGGGFLMGAAIAIDNRSVLPPFVPLWRNSDGVFAECIRKCADDVYVGFLPNVVEHIPPSRRVQRTGSQQNTARVGVSHVLCHLIHGYPWRYGPAPLTDKLKDLGNYLQTIGSLSQPLFVSIVGRVRDELLAGHLAHLQRRSREVQPNGEAYRSWLADVEALKSEISRELMSKRIPAVAEIPTGTLRRLIVDVGAMFASWPDLWAAGQSRS